jgi:hypothetical protein
MNETETIRGVSIKDKSLAADERKLLKAILHSFADKAFTELPMSRQQKRRAVVRLFERGILEIICDMETDTFEVRMCEPETLLQKFSN